MKKILKDNYKICIGIIIGFLLTITSVYATTMISSSAVLFNNDGTGMTSTTANAAITELYQKVSDDKICTLKSGNAYAVGSKYECNPSLDGVTKYNFYVLRVDKRTVKLLMEQNISDTVGSARIMDWYVAMNFFRNGAGKNLGWKTGVELPRAQDIADAVGYTTWNIGTANNSGLFCFIEKKLVSNSSGLCNDESQYNYLYDYTKGCTNNGCTHSLGDGYAEGYWTSDLILKRGMIYGTAWIVAKEGMLGRVHLDFDSYYGVRPVIIVTKANLKN